jgi:hypothetical protein
MPLEQLTINREGKIRHDRMAGRDYLVVPMVMMTEGVANGSSGPLYYPAEELGKTPEVWNHKPVVVYHPVRNGQGVSACDPEVITSRGVGVVMNTHWNGKLRAEAWCEISRLNAVDPRIMQAVEKSQMMELSTGLFTDNEKVSGEFNGKPYEAIARNYRPDHLAILPDMKGACSIEDGAGFLRLNSSKESNMDKKAKVDHLITNRGWAETEREFLTGLTDDRLAKIVDNADKAHNPPAPPKPEPTPAPAPAPAPTGNAAPAPAPVPAKPVTMDEYINNAPAAFQDVMREGLAANNAERGRLVQMITANKANIFTPEQLAAKPTHELRAIAAFAAPAATPVAPVANYGMAAPPPPTTNHVEEPMPEIKW